MNDLLTRVASLEARITECDKLATEHEAAARLLRSERAEKKAELSDLRLSINQMVGQQRALESTHAAQGAERAAQAAQAAAEKHAADLKELLDGFRSWKEEQEKAKGVPNPAVSPLENSQ